MTQQDEFTVPLPLTETIVVSEQKSEKSIEALPSNVDSTENSPKSSLLEGGLRGWLAVLGSLLIHCFVFAPTEFIYGIFVLHYQNIFPNTPASAIAFVGTTGSALTYISGFLSGILADRFGFRPTAFVGSIVMAISLIGASFATQVR